MQRARSRIGQNIKIGDYNFEVCQSFKYLGSVVNVQNDISEEIRERSFWRKIFLMTKTPGMS